MELNHHRVAQRAPPAKERGWREEAVRRQKAGRGRFMNVKEGALAEASEQR